MSQRVTDGPTEWLSDELQELLELQVATKNFDKFLRTVAEEIAWGHTVIDFPTK